MSDTNPDNCTHKNTLQSDDKPLVSVITAVFNGEKFLEQTIDSVLNQTYERIEYIIIDGCSTDGTLDIIRSYQDRIACWISEPDQSVYEAWNKGLDRAHGQWIAFVGSDDVLRHDAVANYVHFILQTETSDLDFVSSKAESVDDDLDLLRIIGKPWKWENFRKHNNLVHVGSFHHRRLFKKFGRFDDRYKIAGDYEFLIRSGKHLKAAFMDRITVKMRASGISNDKRALTETMHVKIHTAGRNRVLCYLECCYGLFKFGLRRLFVRLDR